MTILKAELKRLKNDWSPWDDDPSNENGFYGKHEVHRLIPALETSIKIFEWIADKKTDTLGAHSMRAQASAYGAIKKIEQLILNT
jgi:hypothetical protein